MDATGPSARDVDTRLLPRAGVCAALLGSALVHATVVGEHLDEWLVAGLFFLLLEVVEVGLALASLLAWGSRTAQLVLVSSLGTIAVWGLSRTFGMPFGPADFQMRESVGVPDLSCCALELLAAALAFRTAVGRTASRTADAPAGWARLGLVVAVATALTAWGLQPALAGDSAGRHDMPSGPAHDHHPAGG